MIIYFTPWGYLKSGRRTYKLCHKGGKVFGRAFTLRKGPLGAMEREQIEARKKQEGSPR